MKTVRLTASRWVFKERASPQTTPDCSKMLNRKRFLLPVCNFKRTEVVQQIPTKTPGTISALGRCAADGGKDSMHALIIEDESMIAMALEEILTGCGFTSFDFAASPEQAIAAAARTCPDLITADVDLKPGSGIEAVNEICSGPRIPVIFITGTPIEAVARFPEHPIVLKPFSGESVIAAVKAALLRN